MSGTLAVSWLGPIMAASGTGSLNFINDVSRDNWSGINTKDT